MFEKLVYRFTATVLRLALLNLILECILRLIFGCSNFCWTLNSICVPGRSKWLKKLVYQFVTSFDVSLWNLIIEDTKGEYLGCITFWWKLIHNCVPGDTWGPLREGAKVCCAPQGRTLNITDAFKRTTISVRTYDFAKSIYICC